MKRKQTPTTFKTVLCQVSVFNEQTSRWDETTQEKLEVNADYWTGQRTQKTSTQVIHYQEIK